jgi:hypothetical protein
MPISPCSLPTTILLNRLRSVLKKYQVAMSARFTAAERTSGSSAHRRHQVGGVVGCQPPSSLSAVAWLGGARPSRMGWLSSASAARGELLTAVIALGMPLRAP